MLRHSASDMDQRCLKTCNSNDGCTFLPNIIVPTPKSPQNPILSLCLLGSYKVEFKIPLDMVKYPFWVQKILHYMTLHEGGRHIEFLQTTWLSAYMSSRALATTTTYSLNLYRYWYWQYFLNITINTF